MKMLVIALILVLGVLSACSQEPQALPTLAASSTPLTSDEPSEVPSEAPPTSTDRPRPTLPPTWTPASVQTSTPLPTSVPAVAPTSDPSIPTVIVPTRPPSCDTFGPDLSILSRTYAEGQDVTVYWIDIPEAEFYNIILIDDTGAQVMADYTPDATYVFPADRFDYGRIYGWEAIPINSLGQQICIARGAELVPEVFTTVN
jgi:hypothetical protein